MLSSSEAKEYIKLFRDDWTACGTAALEETSVEFIGDPDGDPLVRLPEAEGEVWLRRSYLRRYFSLLRFMGEPGDLRFGSAEADD